MFLDCVFTWKYQLIAVYILLKYNWKFVQSQLNCVVSSKRKKSNTTPKKDWTENWKHVIVESVNSVQFAVCLFGCLTVCRHVCFYMMRWIELYTFDIRDVLCCVHSPKVVQFHWTHSISESGKRIRFVRRQRSNCQSIKVNARMRYGQRTFTAIC